MKNKSNFMDILIGACVITTTALVVDEFVFEGAGREKVKGLFSRKDAPELAETITHVGDITISEF